MNQEINLLLLEDSPADAELIQVLLRRAGLKTNVQIASDEKEFLAALEGDVSYDAVLADNALPQYNSMEALRMIRRSNPHVAFILVTGTVSEEFAVKIIQQGADDYILKTNLTRLPAAITGAIEKKRSQMEREIAEQETMKEKELSTSIINSLPGIFYLTDNNGRLLRWNKNFERISGYRPEEISKMTAEYFFSGKEKDHMLKFMKKSFSRGQGETEVMFVTKESRKIPYQFTSMAVNFENNECLVCVGLDITSSKDAENELKQLNEQLRLLSAHLNEVKEQEQQRIAREIHDELGQQITGLKMDIARLKKEFHEKKAESVIDSRLGEISSLLDETVKTIRKISSSLRPSILDDLGLVAALEWQSREFEKRFSIPVKFSSIGDAEHIDPAIAIGIFRMYQESLTNVARHSEAKQVTALLQSSPFELVLSIKDDGKGFDIDKARQKKTLGLLGMRERAQVMGGEVNINSEVGKGTEVVIRASLIRK